MIDGETHLAFNPFNVTPKKTQQISLLLSVLANINVKAMCTNQKHSLPSVAYLVEDEGASLTLLVLFPLGLMMGYNRAQSGTGACKGSRPGDLQPNHF